MIDFIAIDFETANPQRVSACAIGYAKVFNFRITESKGFLIKPVGGHAPFQSRIHGIKEEHTCDKPTFRELFPEIKDLFNYPIVAHSLFDKQVLTALSDHFNLGICFDYIDSCALAKERFPNMKDCKLPTLVQYFGLPGFKHHDAREDALACANVFMKLQDYLKGSLLSNLCERHSEFKGLIEGILADDLVDYKEAYELLYWLEDHDETRMQYNDLYIKLEEVLADNILDNHEAEEIKVCLQNVLKGFKLNDH